MSKNDILNELASMGLEAEYRKTISVMLDGFEESIRKDCKKRVDTARCGTMACIS